MKHRFKKFLATIITLTMIFSMLPTQFALATDKDDIENFYSHITESDLDSDVNGHVLKLEEGADDAGYDYALSVNAYNLGPGARFVTNITFDNTVVKIVDPYGGEEDIAELPTEYLMGIGTVTTSMTSKTMYRNRPMNSLFVETWTHDLGVTAEDPTISYVKTEFDPGQQLSVNDWNGLTEEYGYLHYTFPSNELINMYTMYFNLQDGQTEIDADTFGLQYDSLDCFHGACSIKLDENAQDDITTEYAYLIGFPEPETEPTDTPVEPTDTPVEPTDTPVEPTDAPVEPTQTNTPVDPEKAITVTVKDADTEAVITGATVTVNDATVTTDASGNAAINAVNGDTVKVTMAGYTDAEATASGTKLTIKLVPERISVKLPIPVDSEGNPITANPTVTVRKTSTNLTKAWGDGTKVKYKVNDGALSLFALSSNEAELPKNSTFTVTLSGDGYSSVTIYAVTDENSVTYYSDSEGNEPLPSDPEVTLNVSTEPVYTVDVTTEDNKTYTAEVTLKNIDAAYGTFGLRYDKDVFETVSFARNEEYIDLFTPETSEGVQALKPETQSGDDDTIGYHVFTWKANDDIMTLNALEEAKTVATYTFTLKDDATINADSLSVMPYDKTENGLIYIDHSEGKDEIADEFLSDLWRYTDEENLPGSLGEGRIEEGKATDRGFYQAFPFELVDSDVSGVMVDVMTVINGLEEVSEESSLTFEVVDPAGVAVPNTTITVTLDGEEYITLTTDATGIAKVPVDTTDGAKTFEFVANSDGYWETTNKDIDEYKNGVTVDTAPPYTTEFVYITMEEKIYHEPVLQDKADGSAITTATLIGDKFAYNGRDFYFDIEGVPGYEFVRTETVTVVVDGNEYEVAFSEADNMYVLAGDLITGEKKGPADENGFPSDDIIIKIDEANDIVQDTDTITVTALAGENGKVAYSESGDNITATDSEVVVSELSIPSSTGTFTFTADEGYMIEKVVINGVELLKENYEGKSSFEYKFEDIIEDSSIAVTFWDGITPSEDTIVTLVVGERGRADVTVPEAATVSNARMPYIFNGTGTLTFTTTAEDGFELDAVEKSVDGGVNETVAATNGAYTVNTEASQVVEVYVTFKEIGAEDTFNVFVEAYVAAGEGTIVPMGILIYTKHERPTFILTAANDSWKATGVILDRTETVDFGEQKEQTAYQMDSLTKDTSVGAIFEETAYKVYGVIDLAQGGTITTGAPLSGAIVTFTRADGETYTTTSTISRTDSEFEIDVPEGVWTVTVSKLGYLNFVVNGFEVVASEEPVYFGASSEAPKTAKKIIPIIGDTTGNGAVISLEDAGVVANGMNKGKENVSEKIWTKADVDNDDAVTALTDMVYIIHNYGKRYDKATTKDDGTVEKTYFETYEEFVEYDPNTAITQN